MLLTCSSVKPLIIVIGETISFEFQKLLLSMTENKVWRKLYVNFGGLFSQILESFFLRNNIFHAISDDIFIVYKIMCHFILLLANRNTTKSTKFSIEIWPKKFDTLWYLKCFSKRMILDNKLISFAE